MLDHITLTVRDLARSKAFYERALAPLGMSVNLGSAADGYWGFGAVADPEFEIASGRFFISESDADHPVAPSVHVAFRAKDHAAVQAFHRVAVAAGGTDNGSPGPRPQYSPTYYAAFVRDPDGNNIEATYHED